MFGVVLLYPEVGEVGFSCKRRSSKELTASKKQGLKLSSTNHK